MLIVAIIAIDYILSTNDIYEHHIRDLYQVAGIFSLQEYLEVVRQDRTRINNECDSPERSYQLLARTGMPLSDGNFLAIITLNREQPIQIEIDGLGNNMTLFLYLQDRFLANNIASLEQFRRLYRGPNNPHERHQEDIGLPLYFLPFTAVTYILNDTREHERRIRERYHAVGVREVADFVSRYGPGSPAGRDSVQYQLEHFYQHLTNSVVANQWNDPATIMTRVNSDIEANRDYNDRQRALIRYIRGRFYANGVTTVDDFRRVYWTEVDVLDRTYEDVEDTNHGITTRIPRGADGARRNREAVVFSSVDEDVEIAGVDEDEESSIEEEDEETPDALDAVD